MKAFLSHKCGLNPFKVEVWRLKWLCRVVFIQFDQGWIMSCVSYKLCRSVEQWICFLVGFLYFQHLVFSMLVFRSSCVFRWESVELLKSLAGRLKSTLHKCTVTWFCFCLRTQRERCERVVKVFRFSSVIRGL